MKAILWQWNPGRVAKEAESQCRTGMRPCGQCVRQGGCSIVIL